MNESPGLNLDDLKKVEHYKKKRRQSVIKQAFKYFLTNR